MEATPTMSTARTDLDIEQLRQALSGRKVGREIWHHEVVGSTMDEARRMGEGDSAEGAVVVAEEQTQGRGRFNRPWISPRGQNLHTSVLLRPSLSQLPFVNMAATMAVSRTVNEVTGRPSAIKWPNDVRINGRKISGILIETAMTAMNIRYAVVGVGINVNFDPSQFREVALTATSLSKETGGRVDRTTVLRLFLEEFDDLYLTVKEGRSLTEEWAEQLETLGRTVRISWRGRDVEGRASGVDEVGNLVLTRSDGSTFTAVAGEVTLQT